MPLIYSYRAFGLTLHSSDPIAGLNAVDDTSRADIHIWMNTGPPQFPNDHFIESWYPTTQFDTHADGLRVWTVGTGRLFRLLYADGTEFFIDRLGTEIYAIWPESSTAEDTAIYLLGPVFGFALRLRGIACLHASAIEIDGAAVALVGAGQAGKSTTAAAFASMGYRVLTDDIAPVLERSGRPYLQPAYPQLRLWPDSVALLYGSEDALPMLTPSWAKRALTLRTFQNEPLPLAAIYVLSGRNGSEPRIEPLSGRERLRTLVAHSYVGYLLDRTMREQEFASLTAVGSRVVMRRVVAAESASQVFGLCARIVEDWEAIGCTPSPITAR